MTPMRLIVLASTALAACGDDDVSPTDAAADGDAADAGDAGDAASSGGYAGYFRLQSLGRLGGDTIQLLGFFRRGGREVSAASTTTSGSCSREETPAIITGTGITDATMRVLRGDEVILETVPPNPGTTRAPLAAGDELVFHRPAGESFPELTVGPLVVPSIPTMVVFPDAIALGEPVTITWTSPAGAHGDVLVELLQDPSGSRRVTCRVPVADGSITIPSELTSHLRTTTDTLSRVQMAVSPFDSLRETVDGEVLDVELLISTGTDAAPAM